MAMNVAGMSLPPGQPAAANAALYNQQQAAAADPNSPGAQMPVRPIDPSTSQPAALTQQGIPLTNPFARAHIQVPSVPVKNDDTTLDVIEKLTATMVKPGVSSASASRLYDVQQQLWESYKTALSAWNR